jgi:hypothetical protein
MEKIIVELDVKNKKGIKEVENFNKEINKTSKEVSNTKKELKETNNATNTLAGGAVASFNKFKGAVMSVVTGFKSLKFAIIATGIGALLVGILAVKTAFTSSEEGQNKFAKILGVIGALTGNLFDLLADLGEIIISVFENPKQALLNFRDLITQNITNRFESILDTLGFLSTAFKKVFSGDFSGALEDAKKAGISYVDSLTGVKNSIDRVSESVKNFAKEQVEDAKGAAKVADMRAKADKIERELIVKRSKLESEVALLRLKARQEDEFGTKERKEALLEAQELENQLLADQTEYLILRKDAQVLENTFSRSNKENLTKEAEAIAAVNRQVAQRANVARQLQRELNTIQGQIETENKAKESAQKVIDDKKIADDKLLNESEIKDAKTLADLKNDIRDASAVTDEEKRVLELQKVTEHYDKLIELAKLNNISTIDLETAKGIATTGIEKQVDEEKIKSKENVLNALVGLAGAESALGKAGIIAKQLLLTKELLIDLGFIKSKATKTIVSANLDAASSGASVATGFSKTLALGFPAAIPALIGYAGAAVGIISSVKSAVGGAKSVASSIGGSSGSSPSSPSVPTVASTPPSFNVVGSSDTNQLASAIGGQSQKPIKAFVVSSDVSTSQELDRNIITEAGIG